MSAHLWVPLAIWSFAIGTTLWGTWYALRQFRKNVQPPDVLPPVSILKPLKGLEPGFAENVGSFFSLDYPCYEILFSIADPADPAVAAVRALMAANPGVRARLILGNRNIGPNPKVNNLAIPYEQASFDTLLISDSNVRVRPDYLRRVVAHLKPDVGMVTAVVAGTEPEGLGGTLEATYLNSFYARWMQISSAVGHPPVVGKSMLFRRSAMDRFGGISNLAQYIAEDYMAGQAMRRLGLGVVIMTDPVRQHIGRHDVATFWSRHLRWGRIRKAQAPLAFFIEPFLGAVVSGLAGAYAFHLWTGVSVHLFLGIHLSVWLVSDLLLMRRLETKMGTRALVGWAVREFLALPLWLHMASGNSVMWRGNRLRIRPGGVVETSTRPSLS